MTKYIRIDYIVKRDVALDELKGRFLSSWPGSASIIQNTATPRINTRQILCGLFILASFVEEVLPDLQKQQFFLRFTAHLKQQCSIGPDVTQLEPVASTALQTGAVTNLIERATT